MLALVLTRDAIGGRRQSVIRCVADDDRAWLDRARSAVITHQAVASDDVLDELDAAIVEQHRSIQTPTLTHAHDHLIHCTENNANKNISIHSIAQQSSGTLSMQQ
jgi:hypothetical protein